MFFWGETSLNKMEVFLRAHKHFVINIVKGYVRGKAN